MLNQIDLRKAAGMAGVADMLKFEEFVKAVMESQNGVQNDASDVWVELDGEQYSVTVWDVLGREEEEPFEASYALEGDLEHPAWAELYDQYAGNRG